MAMSSIPFIRRRDGTLVYSTHARPVPIPVPNGPSTPTKEMDMRDLDKEEDLLDYADGGNCLLCVVDSNSHSQDISLFTLATHSRTAAISLCASWGAYSATTCVLAHTLADGATLAQSGSQRTDRKSHICFSISLTPSRSNRHVAIKVVKSAKT